MAQGRSVLRFLLLALLIGCVLVGVGLYVATTQTGIKTVLGWMWDRPVDLKLVGRGPSEPLEIANLTVANRPGFGDGPFFEADSMRLDFRPWVLVRKGFDKLELIRPRLSLVINEKGEANFGGVGGSGGWGWFFPVERIRFTEGQVRFEDRVQKKNWLAEGVGWRTTFLPAARGVTSAGWFQIGRMDWSSEQDDARLDSLNFEYKLTVLPSSSKAFPGWLSRLRGSARYDAQSAGIYQNVWGTARFGESGIIVESFHCAVYDGYLDLHGNVDYQNDRLLVKGTAEMDGMAADRLLTEGLKLNLPLSGLMTMTVTMTGEVDAALKPVGETWKAQGRAQVKRGKLVNWSWLQRVAGHVKELGNLDLENVDVEDLDAPFEVTHDTIVFHDLTVRVEGIDCTLAGSLGRGPAGRLDLVLDLDMPLAQLNLGGFGQILSAFLRGDSGRIPVRLHIRGTKKQPLVEMSMLPGVGR
ncbi:MAG: hypothetical protein O7G87_04020 [bacterium]|nr:hypothetical protein [bacterium]